MVRYTLHSTTNCPRLFSGDNDLARISDHITMPGGKEGALPENTRIRKGHSILWKEMPSASLWDDSWPQDYQDQLRPVLCRVSWPLKKGRNIEQEWRSTEWVQTVRTFSGESAGILETQFQNRNCKSRLLDFIWSKNICATCAYVIINTAWANNPYIIWLIPMENFQLKHKTKFCHPPAKELE